ncbi:terminase large subunit domain-containing protein [Marivita geojedonensis]|uniref:terminase large subunit domain-containing protein n=1 Tax=Marivita geojedonensis TaxID=1123756 RepID=UPI000A1FDA68|nr:terminase large subunit [Marivita geojedonensis]PRY76387.1 phage terminase large subunit-like protein [Marivita geojedonensis]
MKPATTAIKFIETLKIPTGRNAGKPMKLAAFQKRFIRGAFDPDIRIAVLSVARGNSKSATTAAIAVAELFGVFNDQPRREILLAAGKRDQAEVVWTYALDLIRSMPDEVQERIKVRYSPKLEIELDGEHKIRGIASDGAGILGTSPTLVICDERASWAEPKGSRLETALLTGALKRQGKTLMISTSAATDAHPFSRYLDEDEPTTYRQDHRAPAGCKPDDPKAIKAANPGIDAGIAPPLRELQAAARRAMSRGGHELQAFRLLHLNQRVNDATNEPLIDVDDWLRVETDTLPEKAGPLVVGLDLGGSASMSAAAFFWARTGRLEVRGWFPSRPGLLDRGQRDGVGNLYLSMQKEGTLRTLGDATVPVASWIKAVVDEAKGYQIDAICYDTFKQSEIQDGLRAAGLNARQVLRRFGPFDGGEDAERFRRAVYDRHVATPETFMMRSALAGAVCKRDGQLNPCLDKSRSTARIDAVSAAVLAVGEGSRIMGRGPVKAGRVAWG